jgi:hypothetical protein
MQLETRRLRVRPLSRWDEPEIAALPFTGPSIRDVAVALVNEGASEQEWKQRGCGPLAVLERGGGRFLGRVGLMYRTQFGETERAELDPARGCPGPWLRDRGRRSGPQLVASNVRLALHRRDDPPRQHAIASGGRAARSDTAQRRRAARRTTDRLSRHPRRHRDWFHQPLTRKHAAAQARSTGVGPVAGLGVPDDPAVASVESASTFASLLAERPPAQPDAAAAQRAAGCFERRRT